MDSAGWRQAFSSFRPQDQGIIVIVMSGGMQIAVQEVSRVEDEVVLIRGRIAGTTDAGRLFLIPYSEINLLYVNRSVLQEEAGLFSPSSSLEEKDKIAKHVAELIEKAKREAREAEKAKEDRKGVSVDLVRQLEELRQSAGFASDAPATKYSSGVGQPPAAPAASSPPAGASPRAAQPPAAQPKPAPSREPAPTKVPPRLNIPPRFKHD